MKKIAATILKEWLLTRRDIAGLLLLLVMPSVLIIIMALIQDAPFRDYQDVKFDLLLADFDNGSVSRQITDGLKQSGNFHVVDSINGLPVTEPQLKQLLQKGDYKVGIVMPKGVTAEVVNAANIVVNDISGKIGLDAHFPVREIRKNTNVSLYFDPVSKPAFRSAISSALDKFISYACTGILTQHLALLNKDSSNSDQHDAAAPMQMIPGIGIKEEPVNDTGKYALHINSVQHNVPAWAIFGMFFIVIPISGHIIRSRQDGSAMRISLIPDAGRYVAMGMIIFYTLICSLQFMIMLCIGLWAMPLFGLPCLYPGLHPWLLFPVSLCIGFAATSYGFFVGTVFRTVNQSLPFGAVSVVIMSAIGGIWVPIEILPRHMQQVALCSPLHWSLEAVNQVILRNGDVRSVCIPLSLLLATGIVFRLLSILIARNRPGSLN